MANTKNALFDEMDRTMKAPKAEKSWNELGIPSDRVAPGAPNPPPPMWGGKSPGPMRAIKKKKMRHGQY